MNKTQKSAIFSLAVFLFSLAVMAYPFTIIFVFKTWPSKLLITYWSPIVFTLLTAVSIVWLRKKQSPAEVDSDEQDRKIKKNVREIDEVYPRRSIERVKNPA